MPVLPATILSVLALLANPLPMLVFAFLLFGVFTLAIIPWALGLLVFFPLYAITHYVSLPMCTTIVTRSRHPKPNNEHRLLVRCLGQKIPQEAHLA